MAFGSEMDDAIHLVVLHQFQHQVEVGNIADDALSALLFQLGEFDACVGDGLVGNLARLCERQAKNLPKAKLTGREKQKLNTQIDH